MTTFSIYWIVGSGRILDIGLEFKMYSFNSPVYMEKHMKEWKATEKTFQVGN